MVFDPKLYRDWQEDPRPTRIFKARGQCYVLYGFLGMLWLAQPLLAGFAIPPHPGFVIGSCFGAGLLTMLLLRFNKLTISPEGIQYRTSYFRTIWIAWSEPVKIEGGSERHIGWPSLFYDFSYYVNFVTIRAPGRRLYLGDDLFEDLPVIRAVIGRYSGQELTDAVSDRARP